MPAYYCQLPAPVRNLHPATKDRHPLTWQLWGETPAEVGEKLREAGHEGGEVAVYGNRGFVCNVNV